MSKCHKDRRAKEKRRRGYKNCLERKIERQNEAIADQNDVINVLREELNRLRIDYYLNQEAMDEFLKKRLAIRATEDFPTQRYMASVRWKEDPFVVGIKAAKKFNYDPDAHPSVLMNELRQVSATDIGLHEFLDSLMAKHAHNVHDYVHEISYRIGKRITNAIMGKLLSDILKLLERR